MLLKAAHPHVSIEVRALRKKVPCSPPSMKSRSLLMGHEMGSRRRTMIHTNLRSSTTVRRWWVVRLEGSRSADQERLAPMAKP